ncbi:ABC transporter ATP-binding protein [Pendulispora rubella]|uniref:ABC transporter ATP-binding protein n=1 Tax=Pendulispora rubella TaxID=2741070 RepID=A0ABZ2L4S8_9BACT
MKYIVELEQVTKEYDLGATKVRALGGIDLTFEKGEFSVVMGPSGSGKSTLLNIVSGLDRATSGKVRVVDVDTSASDDGALSRLRLEKIGFVFQAYNLIPVLTAVENVEYVMLLQGRPPAERWKRAKEMLEAVGLGGLHDRFPRELSGGQQQRVAIARAIAAEPVLVLADEPTANLDSKTAASLMDLMETLNREKGITFIFSTHDPSIVARARRKLTLHDGLLLETEVAGKVDTDAESTFTASAREDRHDPSIHGERPRAISGILGGS